MKKQAQFIHSGPAQGPEPSPTESAALLLTSCGYQASDQGIQYPERTEGTFLLYAIRSGKAICTAGGRQYALSACDVMLIFPETEYSLIADPQEGCICLWVCFRGSQARTDLLQAGFSPEHPQRRSQCLHQMEKILGQTLVLDVTAANNLRASGYFQIFLADLMEEHSAGADPEKHLQPVRGAKTSGYIKNAIDYLSKHYAENVKIQKLADHVGVNRSYLTSSFKQATGYSPKEYLLHLRLEKAKQLLETSELSISSISGSIGYEDPLAFSRIFKRYTGQSPSEYRQEHTSSFE